MSHTMNLALDQEWQKESTASQLALETKETEPLGPKTILELQ